MELKYKSLEVTMPDDSVWSVPVEIIATHRAQQRISENDGSFARSLQDDTNALFNSDSFEIEDWASNNMNWDDVKTFAVKVDSGECVDYQKGWVNGDKEVVAV